MLHGEVNAYGSLVSRYRDKYARYAVHMLGNREDAEEALQDAFTRAYRSLAPLLKIPPALRRLVVPNTRQSVSDERGHGACEEARRSFMMRPPCSMPVPQEHPAEQTMHGARRSSALSAS